jgi:uncharacterized protein (DUF169 family)
VDTRGWADRLKAALNLDTEPVAVGFTEIPAHGTQTPEAKVSVCQALQRAFAGESIVLTADTCGCPGGLVNLGLGQSTGAGKERLVDFLINREQVYCSRVSLRRSQEAVPPLLGVAPCVRFAPLAAATFLPDLVVFLGRPGSLHHLLGLANYWEGGPLLTDLAGPACRTAIGYPIVTGNMGLSLLDFGARRLASFPEEMLLLSVPFHRMIGLMHALERRTNQLRGEDSDSIEKEIEALGPIEKIHA